jgi:ABC-2 type transport system permease protein
VKLVRSEWTKLTSIRLLTLCVALSTVLSVGIVALLALAMNQHESYCAQPDASCSSEPLRPDVTISIAGMLGDGGTPGIGMLVLMLLGVMCLMVEYRYGTIGTTFMATPQKWRVVAAKAAVVGACAVVVGFVATLLAGLVFQGLGGPAASEVHPWSAQALAGYGKSALVVLGATAFALGVAALVRNVVAAVALVLLWPTIIEKLLPSLLPSVGEKLSGLLLFTNARHFAGLTPGDGFPWGAAASGAYFVALCVLLLVVGTAVLHRSDVR